DLHLARREGHVDLAVEQHHDEQPQGEQDAGNQEVAGGVDADVQQEQSVQDVLPVAGQVENDRQEEDQTDGHDRPQTTERDVGDENDQQQHGDEHDAIPAPVGNVQIGTVDGVGGAGPTAWRQDDDIRLLE